MTRFRCIYVALNISWPEREGLSVICMRAGEAGTFMQGNSSPRTIDRFHSGTDRMAVAIGQSLLRGAWSPSRHHPTIGSRALWRKALAHSITTSALFSSSRASSHDAVPPHHPPPSPASTWITGWLFEGEQSWLPHPCPTLNSAVKPRRPRARNVHTSVATGPFAWPISS